MNCKIGMFKGGPTITLNPASEYPFRFGLTKARLIADNFAEIQAFVENNDARAVRDPGEDAADRWNESEGR